jgi:hypothetical protein
MRNPILCSTRRSHFAIETHIRYELTPALVLKLKEYLKANLGGQEDVVSR